MASVQISESAYTTIVLHCAKYPASAVTGVLIGSGKGGAFVVERVVPLQHHWTTLSPMVEAGLSLISASLSSSSQVIGVYYAPSDVVSSKRTELHPTPQKIAQTVATKLGGEAIALQVNNARLNGTSEHALFGFSVTSQSSSQAKHLQPNTISLTGKDTLARAKTAIAQGRWAHLVDFDDHLEDTSLDWLNSPVIA